jgi:hypothetical protein
MTRSRLTGAVTEHVAWYQDPDTIWEWEPPAVDVPILARPDVREALTQMFREGARQGVGGLVDDWVALSLPWGFAFADVRVPVVVWHGELDHLVRPAQAHFLSAVLPNATLVLYPPGRASAVAAALGRDPCRGHRRSLTKDPEASLGETRPRE